MNEFGLIEKLFTRACSRQDVILGVGDDAAIIAPPPGLRLALATDTLNEGVHFLPGTDPVAIGHKALAVNLSDMAAMGARPAWALLSLTIPSVDEPWLQAFSQGFYHLADRYDVALIGGDTTRGPRAITVMIGGYLPEAKLLSRQAARPGDLICVTGCLGGAALALQVKLGAVQVKKAWQPMLFRRLDFPQPQVEAGLRLLNYAHSAIDVSDGLVGDLRHLLDKSGVGAEVFVDKIPCDRGVLDQSDGLRYALAGGDDYELLFTLDPGDESRMREDLEEIHVAVECIGQIMERPELILRDRLGHEIVPDFVGFDHFRRVDD